MWNKEVWYVHKALYGVRQSSRAVGIHRDKVLSNLKRDFRGLDYILEQSPVDSCLRVRRRIGVGAQQQQ